ncbi:MAG: ABC transporter permease subunit [Halioglobus sp.]
MEHKSDSASSFTAQIPDWVPGWRRLKDRLATFSITIGGSGVLVAILLIFFYLLYEVLPLFGNAHLTASSDQAWVENSVPVYLSMEEQGEVGLAVQSDGSARFFTVADGSTLEALDLRRTRAAITAVIAESAASRLLALGHADGTVSLFRHEYRLSYPGGERVITPRIDWEYPGIDIDMGDQAIRSLAVREAEEALVLVAQLANGELRVTRFNKEEDFLSGELTLEEERIQLPIQAAVGSKFLLGSEQRWLYLLADDGRYQVFDLKRTDASGEIPLADEGSLFLRGGAMTASEMLLGGLSVLAASDQRELVQHFMVRSEGGHRLQRIREFDTDGVTVSQLLTEHRRKGFLTLGQDGELQVYHTTSHRRLLSERLLPDVDTALAAIAPRGDSVAYVGSDGVLRHWEVENEHPDISWAALWNKVWYESYDEPSYTWQSSAADNDFEPKYSFAPLAFGTLKAAFYTMLIAAPLAICGAIYTAFFMAPALRRKVKPLIELMEALPTVILGFLAGLWLAPFVEDKLTGVITVMLVFPIGILLFAFAWSQLPLALRSRVPDGWHAVLLIPVSVFLFWVCFAANDPLELFLFDGDMRYWITSELGISFDQRNSLVVGIAMGMAVIPTIFSIAEDALFSVPSHLSYGSLALGATPWQTLVGVVLPTASPGIFSGLMIGLGRAVGETMIVLMATGNTPIIDANIFEGMRTLSANLAVEVPEAEVDSSHYRVLFLAAFVLFLFTFMVNTIAELVRQRLRVKYGSL